MPQRRGLSLLEVIVSLILVSTVLIVSMNASIHLVRQRNTELFHPKALRLAGIVLDELSTLHFEDPDGEGERGLEPDEPDSRTRDDLDDYDGWSQTSPTYRNGQSIKGYEDWKVIVSVEPAVLQTSLPVVTSELASPLRLIRVRVEHPDGAFVIVRSLRCRDGQAFDPINDHLRSQHLQLHLSDDRAIDLAVPHRNRPVSH